MNGKEKSIDHALNNSERETNIVNKDFVMLLIFALAFLAAACFRGHGFFFFFFLSVTWQIVE